MGHKLCNIELIKSVQESLPPLTATFASCIQVIFSLLIIQKINTEEASNSKIEQSVLILKSYCFNKSLNQKQEVNSFNTLHKLN
jgi:hypothetical protein